MFNKLRQESVIAYQSGIGMWAFVLHRITGISLIIYLLMHICVISTSLQGSKSFDMLLAKLTTPTFIVADLALLAAVLFHGFNGIRIVLFDLGIGIRHQKLIFWIIILIAAIGWFYSFNITLPYIIGK